jgi:hypothetical protein
MIDARERERTEAQWRRIRYAVTGTGLIAALIAFPFMARVGFSEAELDWVLVGFGLLYALHIVTDVRLGRTSNARVHDDVRAKDPVSFWITITWKGTWTAAAVIAGLRELLGFWSFPFGKW